MNSRQNLIIANEKVITSEVASCQYNLESRKYDIRFNNGKVYSYSQSNVTWLKDSEALNPAEFRIVHNDTELLKISAIYVFKNDTLHYWYICFENGSEYPFPKNTLKVTKSCINDESSRSVFNYLKQTAISTGYRPDDSDNLLEKQYEKLNFVSEDKVFSSYINPIKYLPKRLVPSTPIFPFGCNASQFLAVQNALENQLSVIQGPPGTGKTQTILNIIANLLVAGKTVQVVSNNNSATENIQEKIASTKYNLGFIVAPLGKLENKTHFVEKQTGRYPEAMQSWASDILKQSDFFQGLHQRAEELNDIFRKQERLAIIALSLQELDIEVTYFQKYATEVGKTLLDTRVRKPLATKTILNLWKKCQTFSDSDKRLSLLFKLQCRYLHGIGDWQFYGRNAADLVVFFQSRFYSSRRTELKQDREYLETSLKASNQEEMTDEFGRLSMEYLKAVLNDRYGKNLERRVFNIDDLWKNPDEVLKEYPLVLSTTFSSRSSLSTKAEFDYVIIDEASQVDVATGALALSCAKNAVIVGDTKQLPNVISDDNRKLLQAIFESHNISQGYNFATNSFLMSVCDLLPGVPQTLLREHYHCHPKIANFFNQKFYNGKLLIMSKGGNDEDVISVVKTTAGDHVRDRMNQRQIDIVKQEILPSFPFDDKEIGIIAPYKNQVKAILSSLSDRKIEVATVHKFQGREKDAIIITTVDDEVTDFSDDPNLLNVAVSRAKKSLRLVVSGNDQPKSSNIGDLIDYIEYNNFSVVQSKVNSVFDFLYRQYDESRLERLKQYEKVSTYDSENLMYALISDVLHENDYSWLAVVCHQPLRVLIRDYGLLDDEEQRYAKNGATHLDFLIYSRIAKKPVLAIEVDGFHYHKKGTVQSVRDKKKDHILELYGIPLLRFATNGSGEKEKLIEKLRGLLSSSPK